MNKLLFLLLTFSVLSSASFYDGSTTASVTLAGGIIKSKSVENVKKYKRKDCPVCKGTGKYLSGDGIKMVDCGYCEPETKLTPPISSSNGVIKSGSTAVSCGPNGCRVIHK
jgi:hypothetical protein